MMWVLGFLIHLSVSKTVLELHEARFALESTAPGKCSIRAGASARYLHVFVMSDNLAHAYAARKTFAVGTSWSRFTSGKWQALLHGS